MKFSITANRMVSHLQAVMGAIPAGSTLPIVTSVLIQAQGDSLTLVGTDLHVQLTATRPTDIERDGALCTPAKKLLDICKALPGLSLITIEEKDSKIELRANRSRFSLSKLSAADFPTAEESATPIQIEITQPQLQRLIKKVSHAIADKDVRYYLNGLCLDLKEGRLFSVATDGHRMAICSTAVSNNRDAQSCIVPRKTTSILDSLLTTAEAPITLRMGANQLAVDLPLGDDGTLQFSSRLIDGKYPDYMRVIPRGNNRLLTVHREDLVLALSRIGLLANKHGGALLSATPNYLSIKAWNENSEEAIDGIDAEYNAPDLEAGFCYSYLIDALKIVTSPRAVITLGDSNCSAKITDPDDETLTLVVMPMRL